MQALLVKMGSFLLILALGHIFRQRGLLPKESSRMLSVIMMNITTPAAILYSFSGMERDGALLAMVPLGFAVAFAPWFAGYLISKHKNREDKLFWMMGAPMLNTMSCAMPLVQSFMVPQAAVALCFFDLGSSMVTFVGAYSATSLALMEAEDKAARRKNILRSLLGNVTAVLYLVMMGLFLMDIRLPQAVYTLAEPIGGANTFIAMFMIGTLLEFKGLREQIREIMALLGLRMLFGLCFSLLLYFLLPVSLPIRSMLAVEAFAPISMMAPPQVLRLGGDERKLGLATPVSYMLSLAASIGVLMLLSSAGII